MLNLDTHILVFALSEGLSAKEKKLLSENPWSISSIVLWELAKLYELERISIDLQDREVIRILSLIHTWPISLEICQSLRDLDFQSDPADELIAATSLIYKIPLLTRDRKIRDSKKIPLAL